MNATASARIPVPADVDRPDQILAGFTGRQLAWLSVGGAAGWLVWQATDAWLPLPARTGLAAPLVLTAAALALGWRDGLSLDRLVLAAIGFARTPRRQIPAAEAVLPPPAWATPTPNARLPAPMTGPIHALDPDGIVDLRADGAALICRAGTVNFHLRTPAEQQALISVFARWLHAVTAPVQILARTDRHDLTHTIAALRQAALGLPHPHLETAALAHADYLTQLAGRRDVLHHDILIVFRDPNPPERAAATLTRRAQEAAGLLGSAGITLTPLDQAAAAAVLRRAADPEAALPPAGLAAPQAVITSRLAHTH